MRPLTNRNPDRTDPADALETSLDPAASEPRAPSTVAIGNATPAAREPAAHGLATDSHALWKRGLYLHEPPFVYALGERHVSQYPVFLPLLTAP